MPTLQLPSVIVREPADCELILRLKATLERREGHVISMAELIRMALRELAAAKNV